MAFLDALTGDAELEALFSDDAQLAAILSVKRALTEAVASAGLVPQSAADAALRALDSFAPDWAALRQGMVRDGVIIPELVRQLRAAADPEGAPAIHVGATSQDIVDTALVLTLGIGLSIATQRLASVTAAVRTLASTQAGTDLMARTRMQPALVFNWEEKLRTWQEPLERNYTVLEGCWSDLAVIQLGGPVGDRRDYGDKATMVADMFASRLGLRPVPSWHSARDRIVALGSALALVTGTLGKIGADIAILAQPELKALALEGGGGSSSMPHKSNPIAAETLVAIAHYNAGLSGTLQHAMVHENERSGAAWTLEWLVLPKMLVATGAALTLAHGLIDRLRVRS